jgi:hypothetical protein
MKNKKAPVKFIKRKTPQDDGPYGEAETVLGTERSVNIVGPKIYQRPQTNIKGNPSIKRPWTRLRKKF